MGLNIGTRVRSCQPVCRQDFQTQSRQRGQASYQESGPIRAAQEPPRSLGDSSPGRRTGQN